MNSSDFKQIARKKLEGKWKTAVCITLAYLLIGFLIGFVQDLLPETGIITNIVSIGVYAIEIPLAFGMVFAFFKLFYGEDVKAFSFWSLGFDNFSKAWGISFRTFLKLIVPLILVIVSMILSTTFIFMANSYTFLDSPPIAGTGILSVITTIVYIGAFVWLLIRYYYYALAQCVAFDNPNLTAKECVKKSKELMTKRRGKFFCLQFSFIGWYILTFLTFGIGLIWLLPYVQMSLIAFYDTFAHEEKVEEEVEVEIIDEN